MAMLASLAPGVMHRGGSLRRGGLPCPLMRTGTVGYPGLLGLQGMPAEQLRGFLNGAKEMASRPRTKRTLEGRVLANLFFEDSTRTRTSFSVAAKHLGAEVVDL